MKKKIFDLLFEELKSRGFQGTAAHRIAVAIADELNTKEENTDIIINEMVDISVALGKTASNL